MEESLTKLINEVREDFQIPPYASKELIGRLITEGEAYFRQLVPGCDYSVDAVYRGLLKNYAYYAYHHCVNDFLENYKSAILTWQLHIVGSES